MFMCMSREFEAQHDFVGTEFNGNVCVMCVSVKSLTEI